MTRIGSLFSGYGGLDMGVQAAIGGTVAWHCEFDPAASKVLAHHWPDIPNLGDITTVEWAAVEPVDVLTGGSPCQDVSHAGKRAGMKAGTRSGLWASMCDAIDVLRPSLVIWENVRGVLSAEADSALEPCAGCVGDGSGTVLRALGRVLGDLADLGYVGGWCGVRAADVGACHGRFRVFVAAWPAADPAGEYGPRSVTAGDQGGQPEVAVGDSRSALADASSLRREPRRPSNSREADSGWPLSDVAGRGLLPTPTSRDGKGRNQRDDTTCLTGALLPSPRATDGTKGRPGQRGSSGDMMLPSAVTLLPTLRATQGGSNTETVSLLLTPQAHDAQGPKSPEQVASMRDQGFGVANLNDAVHGDRWGEYAAAIHRHEHTFGRQAPPPIQPSKKGTPQLSPRFSEWMMGLPEGHVTEVPGLTRNEKLKILGNGVVPAQAAAAVAHLLNALEVAA